MGLEPNRKELILLLPRSGWSIYYHLPKLNFWSKARWIHVEFTAESGATAVVGVWYNESRFIDWCTQVSSP